MRFLTPLSSLVALATVCSAHSGVPSPPRFEAILVGTLTIGPVRTFEGPLGTRVYLPVTGGNFTDTSGKLVATVLPAADTGVVSTSGIFFPEGTLAIVWEADKKLAILQAVGVGVLTQSDVNYVRLETDSPTYESLNSRFLISNVTNGVDESHVNFSLFGLL